MLARGPRGSSIGACTQQTVSSSGTLTRDEGEHLVLLRRQICRQRILTVLEGMQKKRYLQEEVC